MSDRLLKLVWTNYAGGSPELELLQAIAEQSTEQGSCQVSVETLMCFSRTSRATAMRGLKELRAKRWIVTARKGGNSQGLLIQINLPKLNRSYREPNLYRTHCASRRSQIETARELTEPLTPATSKGDHRELSAGIRMQSQALEAGMKVADGTLMPPIGTTGEQR